MLFKKTRRKEWRKEKEEIATTSHGVDKTNKYNVEHKSNKL
jgi:hypothetical protein